MILRVVRLRVLLDTFLYMEVDSSIVTGFLEPIPATVWGIKVIAKLCLPPTMTHMAECITLGGQIYVFIST